MTERKRERERKRGRHSNHPGFKTHKFSFKSLRTGSDKYEAGHVSIFVRSD